MLLKASGGPGKNGPNLRDIGEKRQTETPTLKNVGDGRSKNIKNTVNQNSTAILKNGYYEVNGFKFTSRYYNRLWQEGRQAPTFRASAILEHAKDIVADKFKKGFFRYEFDGWEMIYNPITKEVWHLAPIKPKKIIK